MTLSSTFNEPKSTAAVQRDMWDDLEYRTTAEGLTRIGEITEALRQVSPVGGDLLPDVFATFLKQVPKLTPEERMDPRFAINRAIAGVLQEADVTREVREYTVGDPLSAALACVSAQPELEALYSKLRHVQEAADKAQEAEAALRDLLDRLGQGEGVDVDQDDDDQDDDDQDEAEPPELSEEDQAALAAAQAEAAEAAEALAGKLEDYEPTIGRHVRKAAATAARDAEEAAEAAAGWGLDKGTAGRMDPTERIRLAQRMSTPEMRQVAALLGRLRNEWFAARQTRPSIEPSELHSIELGNNLRRMVPGELYAMVDEDRSVDWTRRFAQRRLAQYSLRSNKKEARGAVIYVEDSSGSMKTLRRNLGPVAPYTWSKGLGLALLGVAKDEVRAFHAVCFGGTGQVDTFAFPDPADFTPHAMLDFAGHFLNGGTCFRTGLDAALALIEEEHARTGKTSADIVFATDGWATVTDAWLAHFKERQAALGFCVYGIGIGADTRAEPLNAICDGRVVDITDLASGKDVRHIFAALATT